MKIFIPALVIALIALPAIAQRRRNPTRCSDYATQAEAQAALQRGETWLDHNRNGEACEAHFNQRNPNTPRPRPTTTPTPRTTPSPRR